MDIEKRERWGWGYVSRWNRDGLTELSDWNLYNSQVSSFRPKLCELVKFLPETKVTWLKFQDKTKTLVMTLKFQVEIWLMQFKTPLLMLVWSLRINPKPKETMVQTKVLPGRMNDTIMTFPWLDLWTCQFVLEAIEYWIYDERQVSVRFV